MAAGGLDERVAGDPDPDELSDPVPGTEQVLITAPFTLSPPIRRGWLPRSHRGGRNHVDMADFLVLAAIAVFVLAMLGLIRGLERI